MPFVHATDTVTHETHDVRFTPLANPSLGSTEICVWQVHIPAGTTGVPHTLNHEEVIVILAGEVRFHLGDDTAILRPGDATVVPAGQLMSIDNHHTEPATVIASTSVGIEGTMADGTSFIPPWSR
jgi:quercetin dioxygenase-like cupin family protein